MPQVQKTLCLIWFWVNPCFSFSPLWGNKKWEPLYNKAQDDGKFLGQNQLDRLQMVQFECPRYWNPCVSSIFGWFPFSHFPLPGLIRKPREECTLCTAYNMCIVYNMFLYCAFTVYTRPGRPRLRSARALRVLRAHRHLGGMLALRW